MGLFNAINENEEISDLILSKIYYVRYKYIIVSISNHILSSWAFEPVLDKSSADWKTREQRPNMRFEVFRPWSRPWYQSTWRIWGNRLYSNRWSLLTALILALCYPISASTRWSSSKSTRYRPVPRIPDRSFSLTRQIISNFSKNLTWL